MTAPASKAKSRKSSKWGTAEDNAAIATMSLYFAKPDRRYALELIDVYAKEVTSRVLPVFDHIEREADDAANQCYDNTGDASAAQQRGISLYSDVTFVREQVTGLAIAGLYHLWERCLKEFLVGEVKHCEKLAHEDHEKLRGHIRKSNFIDLKNILQQLSWSIDPEDFYADLDILRLVTNVIKHGDGDSCKKLLKREPAMFYDYGHALLNDYFRNASNLSLRRDDFARFVDATRKFFEQFPERLPRS
jgi:hypothetical protein